jgi:3-deoxy-manno-octulosonate cytidylyltransferase (CMP-KDO synthetase)
MTKDKEQIVGIIPARYASTRFPGKLLKLLLGKSVLQRTYERACGSKVLDRIIIATDDQRIYDHASAFCPHVVMTSKNCATGTDRLAEVVENTTLCDDASIIVNVQGDEPCLNPLVIDAISQRLQEDPTASMSTAVVKLKNREEALPTSLVKCVMDQNSNALYFSRSPIPFLQKDITTTYYGHLGIYAFRKDFILKYHTLPATPLQIAEDLEQLKVLEHGYHIKVAIVDDVALGVDTPEDLKKVEEILCKQNTSS